MEWIEKNPALLSEDTMEDTGSDGGLLDSFRRGDSEAFAALYRIHHRAVFRLALNLSMDPDAAAELTQEVFVWLAGNPGKFDPQRGDLATFLAGVARMFLRRRRRLAFRWLPLGEAAGKDAGADAAAQCERSIDAVFLRDAIARLPVRYREAIALCDLESRSYEEAAAVVGCAVGTIRSRLHRARELLARKFRPERGSRGGAHEAR